MYGVTETESGNLLGEFTELFLARFRADGRSQPDIAAGGRSPGADEKPNARLLEHRVIVVVCVSHCPTGPVSCGISRAGRVVSAPAVAVRPHFKLVVITG